MRTYCIACNWASQVVLVLKNPPANAGDARDEGLIPGSGKSPGEKNGYTLQYSCLENSMGAEPRPRGCSGLGEPRPALPSF